MRNKNKELIRQIGMNPLKPDSFQMVNEPLINNLFLWSSENIDLRPTVENFFQVKVHTKLSAILLDLDMNNWVGVAASWQHNNQSGQIRIDAKLTEFLLNKAFGESFVNRPFNIKKVNQLELSLLQAFLGNLENKLKDFYEVDAKHPYLMDLIYLVWFVESDEGEIGKISFALPANLKPKRVVKSDVRDLPDINKLANTGIKVPVGFTVGSTRLPLNDIKSLEHGDLLIFENSDISKFYWHLGEIGLVLPEEDHPIFFKDVKDIKDLSEEMIKTQHNDDDPLSSLPLELSAEFQKVLIPLKQVLELKAGGVLPLGSVLDSELTLTAQGKPVAKGELVIIGNQFGMRISDLLIGSKKSFKGGTGGVEIEELVGPQVESKSKKPEAVSFADELKDLEES